MAPGAGSNSSSGGSFAPVGEGRRWSVSLQRAGRGEDLHTAEGPLAGSQTRNALQLRSGFADSEFVTTQTHIPDWKVTTGYRVLLKVGWGVTGFAVYLAAVAVAFGSVTAWWIVAALAIAAMLVGVLLPEPVPREMLNGHRTMVDLKRFSSS